MLLARLSWPANVPLPPYCGVRRVMSVMRPEIVGSDARSSRVTAVAAPVRPELNTGSLWPTTVIVSAKGWIRTVKGHLADTSALTFKGDDVLSLAFFTETTARIVVLATDGRVFSLDVIAFVRAALNL